MDGFENSLLLCCIETWIRNLNFGRPMLLKLLKIIISALTQPASLVQRWSTTSFTMLCWHSASVLINRCCSWHKCCYCLVVSGTCTRLVCELCHFMLCEFVNLQQIFSQDKLLLKTTWIFTTRCYASMVYAMALCLYLCPSVTSRCYTKTAQWIELIFGMEASFHLSYTVS